MKPNCTHFTDVPTLDWHIECWKVWPHTFLTTFPPRELLPKFDPCHLLQKLDFSDDLKGYSKCYAVPTKKKEKQVWLSSISMVPCCTYKTYIVKNGTKLRNKILIFWLLRKLTNVVLSKSVGSASSSLMLSLSFVTLKDVRKNFSRLDRAF